jgi:predicted transcriptional regulator
MQDLITLKDASVILGVTLSTVSYYVRTKQLKSVDSDRRTAHRKQRQLVDRADVLRLKAAHDAESAPNPSPASSSPAAQDHR